MQHPMPSTLKSVAGLAWPSCPNGCPHIDDRGGTNVRIRSLYGKARRKLLYCRLCKKTFSETFGSTYEGLRLPHKARSRIARLLVEGHSHREVARRTGRSRGAVGRLAGKLEGLMLGQFEALLREHAGGADVAKAAEWLGKVLQR